MARYNNYIGGKWVPPTTGKYRENRNPANWDEVIGEYPVSSKQDLEAVIDSARKAYKSWRLVPAPQRGVFLRRIGDLMLKYKEELAQLMTREMGKVIKEARGDVQEGIDTAYYAAGETRRLFAPTVPSELPDKACLTMRIPIGIAGIITPWNFPIAIPTWNIFPAIATGNVVILKPASDTPGCAVKLMEIIDEAGVPPGVVNLICGSGKDIGMGMVEHPDIKVISFTGSVETGRKIAEHGGKYLKKVSLELGGKNAQLVLADANLELALDGILWGAFGTTGQRCTATSRLILEESIYDKFLDMLIERTKALKLGNGLDPSVDVGPIINKSQLEHIHKYVEIGKKEGARLLIGGEPIKDGELGKGWFYKPTIFADVTRDMRIFKEEIFGPVLSVIKVKDYEEGLKVMNDTTYGLSSAIFTNDLNKAFAAMRDAEAGITYINGSTIGAEAHLPFGGVKNTGNGHREGGWTVFDLFTDWKAIYVDYSGKLQKAQIDLEEVYKND